MTNEKITMVSQNPTPIEKAKITLAHLSGSGKFTDEQATNFVAIVTCPYPPMKPRFWQLWKFPVYLFLLLRFKRDNKSWEKEFGRKNDMLAMRILKNREVPFDLSKGRK